MKDLGELMKQAQGLQAKMQQLQEKIGGIEVEGAAGGGMVRIVMNGKGYARSVAIEKSLLVPADAEVLEDLVAAAINDAKAKMETRQAEEMKAATAGLPLPPGMKLPF